MKSVDSRIGGVDERERERERERESYRVVVRRDAACRSKMGSTDSGLGGVGAESKLCEGVRERQICKSEED